MPGQSSGYLLAAPGEQHLPVYSALGVNLMALAQRVIIPSRTADKFIIRAAWCRIASKTGTLSVAPVIRIGNNGTFSNMCAVTTLIAAVLDQIFALALASPLIATPASPAIAIDIQTAATGVTVLTGDIYVQGHFV